MLKKYSILILAVFFAGCSASSKAVYKEVAGFNVLDFGSYQILIDKKFEPVGDIEGSLHTDNIDDNAGSNMKVVRYIFADASDGKQNVKRAVVVYDYRLRDPHQYFMNEPSFDHYKGKQIEHGITELGTTRCAYLIWPARRISQDVLKLGAQKGYKIGQGMKYGVAVRYAKNVSRSRVINIVYIEGGQVNYENDHNEAIQAFKRSKSYIKLEK